MLQTDNEYVTVTLPDRHNPPTRSRTRLIHHTDRLLLDVHIWALMNRPLRTTNRQTDAGRRAVYSIVCTGVTTKDVYHHASRVKILRPYHFYHSIALLFFTILPFLPFYRFYHFTISTFLHFTCTKSPTFYTSQEIVLHFIFSTYPESRPHNRTYHTQGPKYGHLTVPQ